MYKKVKEKKVETKLIEFKVLKQFTREKVYNQSETILLNNKKEIEFLKINKYIK
jgi:hypothetical protein